MTRPRTAAARPTAAQRLSSPASRYWAFAGFVALVFLLGGGARSDLLSLIVLRPLAILAAAYALWARDGRGFARAGVPLWLLAGLMGLMAIQLAPLPYGLWTSLPGRELVVANDRAAGIGEIWRAISLAPSRTRNSLFSLAVPLATLLLLAAADTGRPDRLLWPFLAMAAASALLGLLQVLGPSEGPLYLYRITNPGSPVGLFANRNHHAIFLASLFPLLAYAALRTGAPVQRRALVGAASIGSMLFLIPLIVATGSRAGAALLAASLAATALLWLAHPSPTAPSRRRGAPGRPSRRRLYAAAGVLGAIALVGMVTLLGARSLAFERLFEESLDTELRVRVLPQLLAMAEAYFPVGTGFGTFDLAFKVAEPLALLRTNYLNQAHNDALQVVIEGGLPGVLLVAAFLAWVAGRGWTAGRDLLRTRASRSLDVALAPFAWTSLVVLLLGSLSDYPLRTPSLMAYAAALCFVLARPGTVVPRR